MAFIETVPEELAPKPVEEIYEERRARLGYVPNYARVFARRPAFYAAWQALIAAVEENMDARRYELATIAAAGRLRSSYCALAHGKVLAEQFFEPATVRDLAVDHRSAGLDPVDVAVMDFAAKVAGDAASVTAADVDHLRKLGLSDDDVVDVAAAAAARSFFSKMLDALGAEPDVAYGELEPELREALTVGRPIAEGR